MNSELNDQPLQHDSTKRTFLPSVEDIRKKSTALCDTIFEELDATLALLDTVRGVFNPVQRQLVGRFITACKLFARDMLAAEGDFDALRAIFGFSFASKLGDQVGAQATGAALIDEVCTVACADLENIGSTVLSRVLDEVADVIAGVRSYQDQASPEREALEAMASNVRNMAYQVAALFEAMPYALRRHQLVYQADIEALRRDTETAPRVSLEEFKQSVKPPVRRPTVRELLEPFIPQLVDLRGQGYTYEQCVVFLRGNGISTYAGAISSVLREVSLRTADR